MKFKYAYSIVVCLFFIVSCVFRHVDEIEDLGNNYYFLVDGKMSTIYYNLSKDSSNRKGIEVVSPRVINYNYNDHFIIAKSLGFVDDSIKYWIIDKNGIDEKVNPLDSLRFYNELNKKNIQLIFERDDNMPIKAN